MITVYYDAVDGFAKKRKYRTLKRAQEFAQKYVGATPELGTGYAVSGDGVGRIMVDGASLLDLFPALKPPPTRPYCGDQYDE